MYEEEVYLLREIGLTNLESNIYITLLQNPNSSGYKIAKLIGKAFPNTYKALDSLHKKGLIIADNSSKTQLFKALPIREYFDQLARDLAEKKERTVEKFKALEVSESHEGIYRLESVEQVYARSIEILKSAKKVVLVEFLETPLKQLREILEEIARKGVKVIIQGHCPEPIEGCEIIPISEAFIRLEYDILKIIIDGEQYLYSLFKKDESKLFEAIWSKNQYLSLIALQSTLDVFVVTNILSLIHQGTTVEEISSFIKRIFSDYYYNQNIRNYREIAKEKLIE